MITFVRNPEIQLFTDFINRFGNAESLRDRTERIAVVVPGDMLAGVFCDSEPFAFNKAINKGSIWYNECKNFVVHAANESKVVVQCLDSYIVAEKNGQLLVCSLKEEQKIKKNGK